jgi:hypothetical protein
LQLQGGVVRMRLQRRWNSLAILAGCMPVCVTTVPRVRFNSTRPTIAAAQSIHPLFTPPRDRSHTMSTPVVHPPRAYVRIKVVSLGDAAVGKSCLIKRYCEKKFVPKYISTIGVDFGVRQVRTDDGVETKVNFCTSPPQQSRQDHACIEAIIVANRASVLGSLRCAPVSASPSVVPPQGT